MQLPDAAFPEDLKVFLGLCSALIGNVVRQTCCSGAPSFVQYVEVLQNGRLPVQHCEGCGVWGRTEISK